MDRNIIYLLTASAFLMSLSARRAWIEIRQMPRHQLKYRVALRKESVDRNISALVSYSIIVKSLSARRAWIEILLVYLALIRYLVALRKESVDRNIPCGQLPTAKPPSRSPQGERG